MHNAVAHGNLSRMSAVDAGFRRTLVVSLLVHAAAFGSVWGTTGRHPGTADAQLPQDIWVGTTVSVVAQSRGDSVPASPESKNSSLSQQDSAIDSTAMLRAAVPKPPKHSTLQVDNSKAKQASLPVAAAASAIKRLGADIPPSADHGAAGFVDLKQAMLDASNQKSSGSGTFGAVGVDLRERRLPAAFTRALPVAIGAEPGWWRRPAGQLGKVRFEVALNEAGKIEDLSVEDEARHAFLAGIVRRVGRLLAVGRYALPATATPNARQRFELWLDLEDRTPSSNDTAEAGDAVDMGWEAPSADGPGKAHIQEAKGRRMRATLRVLPLVRETSDVVRETAHEAESE